MLRVSNLTYRIGERLLLDEASFALPAGARVGLVGRNGTGKTTLFRLVAGEIAPESGEISLPRQARLGGVAQEARAALKASWRWCSPADRERAALLAEAEAADGLRRAEIETPARRDIGSHSAPARAAAILHGLGSTPKPKGARARLLRGLADAGGAGRRAVLRARPAVLDEPTNYLDLEGTLWLYDYPRAIPSHRLIISHDRELWTRRSTTSCIWMEPSSLSTAGATPASRASSPERQAVQAKLKERQDAERRHLQSFVDRFRAKASKARQAQSRLKRLARMEPVAALVADRTMAFHLPGPERPLSPPLVAMEKVSAGYGERVVLDRLNLTLLPDDRIALLGANGNGKSTLCKLLGGRLRR
jgi:ATP-binding cassette subfamily F protein 3